MEQLPKKRMWLPSPGFLVFLGFLLVFAAIAIPGVLSAKRASNERTAATMLAMLRNAEADFRTNDWDGNKVNDFWTGDVSGLRYVVSAETKAQVKLIDITQADADSKPLLPLPKGTLPMMGYFFMALDRDDNCKGAEGEYKTDTDKSGRKVHHEKKFGFCAFPKNGWAGKHVFRVNETNTIFRQPGTEPGNSFPDNAELKSHWSPLN